MNEEKTAHYHIKVEGYGHIETLLYGFEFVHQYDAKEFSEFIADQISDVPPTKLTQGHLRGYSISWIWGTMFESLGVFDAPKYNDNVPEHWALLIEGAVKALKFEVSLVYDSEKTIFILTNLPEGNTDDFTQ